VAIVAILVVILLNNPIYGNDDVLDVGNDIATEDTITTPDEDKSVKFLPTESENSAELPTMTEPPTTTAAPMPEKLPDSVVSSTERGNTVGNIVNGGYVAQKSDWIYYQSNDGGKLYKIRTDGSSRTKLNDDSSYWINVVGDWVYYTNFNDDIGKFYKIRTDGTERQLVD